MPSSLTALALASLTALGAACTVRPDHGSNRVVVGMSHRASGDWQQQGDTIEYGAGWAWDPHRIMPQGTSTITATFQVPRTSEYVVNMETMSRHSTEYNDLWFRVNGMGLWKRPMYNSHHRYGAGGHWLKLYQNRGGWAREVFTTDHNPMAVTGWFEAGKTYQMQISGRSTHFRVKNIALVACTGAECSPRSNTCNHAFSHGMHGNKCY